MGCLSSKVASDVVENIVAETMEAAGEAATEAVQDIVEETIGETLVGAEDTAAEAGDAGAIPRPVVAVRDDQWGIRHKIENYIYDEDSLY